LKIESIRAAPLAIPFKTAFRHAAAERNATQSLWVEARAQDGTIGFGEGCPREYVTAESLTTALDFVREHGAGSLGEIRDAATLADWVASRPGEIDANPAAWTAVEIALLDLIGKCERKSVESLLGLPEIAGRFRYTAVLGDASPVQFEAQLAHYLKAGFTAFKIKLSGDHERDLAKVRTLTAAGVAAQAVRADANNLWRDAASALHALETLDFPFFALEEPLRAGDYAGMDQLAAALGSRIILDESLLRSAQLAQLAGSAERWIVNLRVSKMGGVLRSLELVRELRRRGLRVIIGAHVGETSVLTRAALTIAHGARDIVLAQEGAFGTHLLARDVAEPPVMFGPGGILDTTALNLTAAGFGLTITGGA
jgi:L-alanine-DL-glutamate epimerase-like enolase superfamily enzyme